MTEDRVAPGSKTGVGPHARELRLLVAASRTELDAQSKRLLEDLLAETIDWPYILRAGGLHGVLPLLQLHLGHRETVPSEVRRELRGRVERVARSNLHLFAELLTLTDALHDAGVQSIVLKGPAVAATLYPNLSLREFGDIDILVRRADVAVAADTIRSLGFEPWRATAGAQDRALEHMEYSRTFTRASDALDIDLHWDMARSFFVGRVDPEALWAEAILLPAQGRGLTGLSNRLLLLTLCIHGAKHGPFPWPRLKWVCDVAEFVRGDPYFDWTDILRLAREMGCRRTLLLGLAMARPLLDGRLPPPVRSALSHEPRIEELARRIWLWHGGDEPVTLAFTDKVGIDLTLTDDAGSRIGYTIRRLFTPTSKDWELLRLPRGLGVLYVPIRIARLAVRYASRPRRFGLLHRRSRPGSV